MFQIRLENDFSRFEFAASKSEISVIRLGS